MQEIRPGLYQGVYSVRVPDTVRDGVVVGWLRKERQFAFAPAPPVTIDTTPPRILRRTPGVGEVVKTLASGIVIAVGDPGGTGVDAKTSRLLVNGEDVTERATWTSTAIGYVPSPALTGQVNVQLLLTDRAGNVTRDQYVFYIGAGPEPR